MCALPRGKGFALDLLSEGGGYTPATRQMFLKLFFAMAHQTSIHICPLKPGSEAHNTRARQLDYVRRDLTPNNQCYYYTSMPLDQLHGKIKEDYAAAHGKKMHAKATPIREAVAVIEEGTTMQQLQDFCEVCERTWGIKAVQIHLHKDEGHYAKDGTWKPNLHAHIVFDWYNFDTHTTAKLTAADTSFMQTILADCLEMDRGVSSDRKHLNAIQQKNKAEAEKLQQLQEQLQQVTEQHKAELQQECKDLRKSGKSTVKAFDYLATFEAATPSAEQQVYRDNLAAECQRELPTDTQALSQHAWALRLYLMNTINAVTSLGRKLQELADGLPLRRLKRGRLQFLTLRDAVGKVKAQKPAQQPKLPKNRHI